MLAMLVAFGAVLGVAYRQLPPAYDPTAPLDLAERPTFVTPFKMRRLEADSAFCRKSLARASAELEAAPIAGNDEGCGAPDAYRLIRSEVPYGGDVRLACPAMAALLMWERTVARPLAEDILGTELVRIDHYGTYACRNINGAATGRLSFHASANAIDIAGFRFADGRRVSVLGDWDGEGAEARYLAAVHHGACEIFTGVLGPDYNRQHANHFHFEMGRWSFCR